MARPRKDGLLYFSMDTDFFYADRRIKALRSRYGSDGIVFYIYLLTEIYRNGYYIRWDDDSVDNAIVDLGLTEGLIEQIMTFLVNRSLLERILVNSDTIITSPGIQKRYQEAVKSLRRDIQVDEQIWLLDNKDTASCIKYTKNVDKSGKNDSLSCRNDSKSSKNRTKEIKGKEIKENERKQNHKADKPPVYFPNDDKLNDAFVDYVEMRRQIKKPMTGRAVSLAMNKLQQLSEVPLSEEIDNNLAVKILEQSIMNSWQGIFPLKENGAKEKQGSSILDEWRNA